MSTSPPDKALDLEEVFAYVDEHRQEFIERLIDYVRRPSISAYGEGMREVAEYIAGILSRLGVQARILPTAGWPMVLGQRADAPGRPTVLLYGHYDVQPPDPLEAWISPPFEPTIRNGRLYARGVGDNKGQHFAQILALESLLACRGALPCNVTVLLEGEEEIGSPHLPSFAREHREELQAHLVLTSDGPVDESGRSRIVFGVPAGLTWLTAVYTGRTYLRSRRDPRIAAYRHATVLLAAALTVFVPGVYLTIDRVVGLPNAARWIGYSLILLAAYTLDRLYIAMPGGSPSAWHRYRRLLAYLLLTLALMAWMLGLARLRASTASFEIQHVTPPLIAYRLLYLTFFAVVIVRMIGSCMRYLRASNDATVTLAMVLHLVGAAWAIVYLVATLLVVLLPASVPASGPLHTVIQVCILVAVVCLLSGATLPFCGPRAGVPTLMRQLRMLVAYWRLRSLWRVLMAEAPTVILPLPVRWQSALFAPEKLDLLLYRRVIEILDAWRQLDGVREMHEAVAAPSKHAPRSSAPGPARSRDEEAHPGRGADIRDAQTRGDGLERHAHTDAQPLVETIKYLRRHPDRQEADQPLVRGMITAYQPTSYVEQLRYLERVARYLRAERRRHAVQQR